MTSHTKRYTLSRNVSLLREGVKEQREEFARTMLGKMETDPHFIKAMGNLKAIELVLSI